MNPREFHEYQMKLLQMLYGKIEQTDKDRRFWQACHLMFGNGSEQTRRECDALSVEEKQKLIKEFCI